MLEKITGLPPGIDGVNAVETVTKQDYEAAFTPLFDAARRENRHIRLLYQLGREFHKITVGGAWVDAVIGIRDWRLFEGLRGRHRCSVDPPGHSELGVLRAVSGGNTWNRRARPGRGVAELAPRACRCRCPVEYRVRHRCR